MEIQLETKCERCGKDVSHAYDSFYSLKVSFVQDEGAPILQYVDSKGINRKLICGDCFGLLGSVRSGISKYCDEKIDKFWDD